jgi:hypothetical protein
LLELLGDSSHGRRRSIPVREEEWLVRADRLNREDNPSRGYGGLVCVVRSRRLQYVRGGVTDDAVRVRYSIRVEVHLLESGAEEKQDDAQNGEQQTFASVGCPVLYATSA